MSLIEHTVSWANGEMFEATLMGAAGVGVAAIALAFWTLGQTPQAKAMLIPLLVCAGIFTSAGISGYVANRDAIPRYERAYEEDPQSFVTSEKERVEGFDALYAFTITLALVCFALAIPMFWFSQNPHVRAVAIAFVVIGLAGLIIDAFAKERADVYYDHILIEARGH